jgi:hypothetical protein
VIPLISAISKQQLRKQSGKITRGTAKNKKAPANAGAFSIL